MKQSKVPVFLKFPTGQSKCECAVISRLEQHILRIAEIIAVIPYKNEMPADFVRLIATKDYIYSFLYRNRDYEKYRL